MWTSFQIPENGFPLLSKKKSLYLQKWHCSREVKVGISALQNHCFPFHRVSLWNIYLLYKVKGWTTQGTQNTTQNQLPAVSQIFLQNIHNELLWSSQCLSHLKSGMEATHSRAIPAPLHSFLPHASCSSGHCRSYLIMFVISQQMALQNRALRRGGWLAAGDLSPWERAERAEAAKEMLKLAFWWWAHQTLKPIILVSNEHYRRHCS